MPTWKRLAACLVALVLGAAACSPETPTSATAAPAGPRLDGVGFGSGNFTGGGATTGSVAADSGSTTTQGVGFGSGN
jgi:hypothetical protein